MVGSYSSFPGPYLCVPKTAISMPSILQVVTLIRPETPVRWHRAGDATQQKFQLFVAPDLRRERVLMLGIEATRYRARPDNLPRPDRLVKALERDEPDPANQPNRRMHRPDGGDQCRRDCRCNAGTLIKRRHFGTFRLIVRSPDRSARSVPRTRANPRERAVTRRHPLSPAVTRCHRMEPWLGTSVRFVTFPSHLKNDVWPFRHAI